MRLLFLLCTLLLSASLQAQSGTAFTVQPRARAASLGGDAEFTFQVRTSNQSIVANGEFDYFTAGVTRDGQDAAARFTLIAQYSEYEPTTVLGGGTTLRSFTLRLRGVTAADAGTYRFQVKWRNVVEQHMISQPVALTISDTGAAALPRIATLTAGFTAAQGTSGGFPLQVALAPGSPASTYQWYRNGSPLRGETTATYRRPLGAQLDDTGAYHVVVANAAGALTSEPILVLVRSGDGPVIERQPVSTEVIRGESGGFRVVVRGSTLNNPRYQWLFNGRAIENAEFDGHGMLFVSELNAGEYSVIVKDARLGAILSESATLTVVPPEAPTITVQPQSVTQVAGHSVRLFAAATGKPAPTRQWHKDGVPIPFATLGDFSIVNATEADAGSYTYVATNSGGTTSSEPAIVTITPASAYDPARLVNISVRASLRADETMTLGTVLGGAGTSGAKPLLLRAVGPSLAPLGVTNYLPDPRLELYSGQTLTAANDNWGGTAALRALAASLGAFAYQGDTSLDAALYQPALPAGAYTVQVRGVGAPLGNLLAELYDATPAGTLTPATPRLINISLLKNCGPYERISVGFVVRGAGARTVLIRAIGQQLTRPPFNIAGVIDDPNLLISTPGRTAFARNDNWTTQTGGATVQSINAATAAVGAFPLTFSARDSVLLVRLEPGSYTVEVDAVSLTPGLMLVEVYDVP